MPRLTDKQIREAARIYGSLGGRPKGHKLSQETKDRMSASHRARIERLRAEQAEQEKEAS